MALAEAAWPLLQLAPVQCVEIGLHPLPPAGSSDNPISLNGKGARSTSLTVLRSPQPGHLWHYFSLRAGQAKLLAKPVGRLTCFPSWCTPALQAGSSASRAGLHWLCIQVSLLVQKCSTTKLSLQMQVLQRIQQSRPEPGRAKHLFYGLGASIYSTLSWV